MGLAPWHDAIYLSKRSSGAMIVALATEEGGLVDANGSSALLEEEGVQRSRARTTVNYWLTSGAYGE